jgi:hypothetical protein
MSVLSSPLVLRGCGLRCQGVLDLGGGARLGQVFHAMKLVIG